MLIKLNRFIIKDLFRRCSIFLLLTLLQFNALAQDNLYARYTTTEAKNKTLKNLINYTIYKNLSLPLSDSTEENWSEAFAALELLLYKNSAINRKIDNAIASMELRSESFQRSLLELAYTNYSGVYTIQITSLLKSTGNAKIFAMCAEYILQRNTDSVQIRKIEELMSIKFPDKSDPIIAMLAEHISQIKLPSGSLVHNKFFVDLLNKNFLSREIVMYSFQRKDRNYPGLVLIRNAAGKFIRDTTGKIFNVPQLARSITNLPGYLTNGNTPQGIFKMYGFGVSSSAFIGPSPNIQMAMPGEMNLQKFFRDTTLRDSVWSKDVYGSLLPKNLREYKPLFHSYYAGLAGRTEIISHGTAIDPEYYKGQPYYPHTPSAGCLSTKEIWNGRRIESNQKKLIEALLKAGGADGYCVVVDLDDKKSAVTIKEILPLLLKAESVK